MWCVKMWRIADVDIEVPDLREEAASQSGYQITKTQMTVYGICSECQNNDEDIPREPSGSFCEKLHFSIWSPLDFLLKI